MSRVITVGAAQLGAIQRADSRAKVIVRMIELLRQAKSNGCDLVAFPELGLTTFFPRWYMEDQAEVDTFFEREMPSNETAPLFNAAREYGIAFTLGFAELTEKEGRTRRFNTPILDVQLDLGKQVAQGVAWIPQGTWCGNHAAGLTFTHALREAKVGVIAKSPSTPYRHSSCPAVLGDPGSAPKLDGPLGKRLIGCLA